MKQKLQHTPEGLFTWMRRHPYLLTFVICAILLPFGFADRANITATSCIYLGVVAGILTVAAIFCFNLGDDLSQKLILSVVMLLCITACMLVVGYAENKATAAAVTALIVALGAIVFIKLNYNVSDTLIITVLIALGIAIRFVYVLYTGSGDRQHDVGYWNWTWGHANYIEYWYNNGLKLPDFDVRSIWQYYQPPLHHWLMALLLKLLTWLGIEYLTACEALQILPMLYSSLIMVVCYRIFRRVRLHGMPLIIAMAIISFHPTFILIGGFFNNDTLCTLMMLLSILSALKWYKDPSFRRIIPIALCVGLGMMSKLNAWMVAPAIALVFLYVFIKNIKSWLKYIGQFAAFGVICAPLGLWWQVRNLITFGVPLTYVPYLSESDPQYFGDLSPVKRLFDFGSGQLSYVYTAFTDPNFGSPYNEFNPTVGLIKTALFGEGQHAINHDHFPQISITAPILFWIGAVLALVCFVSFIIMMLRKDSGLDGVTRAFFSVLALTMLVCYYLYSFVFPFTCSLNIRFCVALIPLLVMGFAMLLQRMQDNSKPVILWLRRGLYALTAAFCAMSYIVYTQVGITVF